jgi:hypothetical protein
MPTYEDDNFKPKHQAKSPDECGAVWLKYNGNKVEYLSMKIEIDGKTHNIKAFLNSAKRDDDDNRPKWIAFKSKKYNQKQRNKRK